MILLKCCWAWTYWKVQGQTIRDKVVYAIGNSEAEHGVSYVMFSCVCWFSDIGLLNGINATHLQKVKKKEMFAQRLTFERKLNELEKETKEKIHELGQ